LLQPRIDPAQSDDALRLIRRRRSNQKLRCINRQQSSFTAGHKQ